MRFLNAADVRAALPMRDAIEAMKLAFSAFSAGRADVPPRIHLGIPQNDGISLVMPSFVWGDDPQCLADQALAVKVASVFERNPARGHARIQAAVLVFDPQTGRPEALLDGATITAIRTGAASGAATDLLSRSDSRTLAVFGAGTAGELQLRSPIDGVVVAVQATLGETASADRAAFIVTDPSRVWVRGNVPELEIARVEVGSAAIVRLHAFPDLSLPGTIVYVAPALDEHTRSLPIRVSLARPDARLRSGLFGSVELVGGAADERVLVVPIDAVASVEGQTTVFVPAGEPNTFRPQAVELGRRAGGYYEIRGGLAEGAPLAVSGAFTLKSALQSGELGEAD